MQAWRPSLAVCLSVLCWAALTPGAALGSGETLSWLYVGDPGNRNSNESEAGPSAIPLGAVDHEFHITQTQVTVSQWLEFVVAYGPYATTVGSHFTSSWVSTNGTDYSLLHPDVADFPADVSWTYAVRYCNWIHNGKAGGQWAFESGVYDTSTWHLDDEGRLVADFEPSPDAIVRLPTLDELIKAAYYDPDRYGPGQEGYWTQPNASDQELISGLPEDGGETNAGIVTSVSPLPVGSYPDVQSHYGLLDFSGAERDWTTSPHPTRPGLALVAGSWQGADQIRDELAYTMGFDGIGLVKNGFRLVTTVPSPSTAFVLLGVGAFSSSRRRERKERWHSH